MMLRLLASFLDKKCLNIVIFNSSDRSKDTRFYGPSFGIDDFVMGAGEDSTYFYYKVIEFNKKNF